MNETGNDTVFFEVKGPDNYERHRDFQLFALLKNNIVIIAAIFIVLGSAANLRYGNITSAVSAILMLAVWCGLMILFIHNAAKRHMESPLARNNTDQYLFYQDFFVNNESYTQSIIRYDMLIEAYETKKYFYLYIEPNKAHIVEKAHFIYNTPEEMRNFLRIKLGNRFIVKTK